MSEDKDYQSWERRQGEPARWFARFAEYYLPLGAERRLEAAFRAWLADQGDQSATLSNGKQKRPSPRWYKMFAEWGWKSRAEDWDQDQRRQKKEAEDKERQEWQDKRRQLMVGFFAKIAQAINKFEPSKGDQAKLTELTSAVKMILDQNRLEYGLPTDIVQNQQVFEVEWRESNDQ